MKARIVKDGYCGYEAQFKRWWWPFWTQTSWAGIINTFSTLGAAEAYAKNVLRGRVVKKVELTT